MSNVHSEETHKSLLARVPDVTGRQLPQWFEAIDNGPSFLRVDERVNWLQDEHEIPHGYASAIVHEHERRRVSGRG
jgi:hypothetical protein